MRSGDYKIIKMHGDVSLALINSLMSFERGGKVSALVWHGRELKSPD
jgi:hypothetical protein